VDVATELGLWLEKGLRLGSEIRLGLGARVKNKKTNKPIHHYV